MGLTSTSWSTLGESGSKSPAKCLSQKTCDLCVREVILEKAALAFQLKGHGFQPKFCGVRFHWH